MRVIAIEEHWTTERIDRALRAQPGEVRDESVALNDRGTSPSVCSILARDGLRRWTRQASTFRSSRSPRPVLRGFQPAEAVRQLITIRLV
jgi:hypothetical protein